MNESFPRWVSWAQELQSLAQAGLEYSKDPYDLDRFRRIREIAAEMTAEGTGLPLERVTGLFCSESGYQTPKLDTRAALFQDGKILLVQERDRRWALPGGWVDVDQSVRSNTVKEVLEEAGLEAEPLRLIAVQDRNLRNPPPYIYGVCKIFVLCRALGGQFRPNLETLDSGYFPLDALPSLAEEKTTAQQIELCFKAYLDPNWVVPFD